jgi:ribonuclease Z
MKVSSCTAVLACVVATGISVSETGAGASARVSPTVGDAGQASSGVLKITLLGTGNPRPSIERFGPSTLIEAGSQSILIDAGRGLTQRLFQIEGPTLLRSIDRLLLTHLHSDHIIGLPDIHLTGWIFGRTTPLTVYGPSGTSVMVAHLQRAFEYDRAIRQEDIGLPASGNVATGRDVSPGVVFDTDGLTVAAFTVDHGPIKPAFGYRITYQKRVVVLSGDTRMSPEVIKQAQGADVLIHEVVSPEAEARLNALADPRAQEKVVGYHTTPEQCGQIFATVKPRLAVYSHIVPSPATAEDLIPATRKSYDGPLEVGYDLMMITVGDEVKVEKREVKSEQ